MAKPWNPAGDELQYLDYGRTIALTGQFAATPAGPQADVGPGREPLYPVLVAVVMRLDPVLADSAARCIGSDDSTCPPIYRSLLWVNALLVALTAALTYLTARALDLNAVACWVSGFYIALNFEMMKSARYVISDYLAMALVAGLVFAIALAMAKRQRLWRWIAVGVLIGLLILTKGIFEIYALFGIIALVVGLVIIRDRVALLSLVAVSMLAFLLVGSWVARNDIVFGRPALTDSRGGIALSTREELDHMTSGQYVAAFLWWLRGPGPSIARGILPEHDWHRFELYAPDGFYIMGQVTNYEKRVHRLMDERGLNRTDAETAVPSVIVDEILGDFPMYLATTLPVLYRGLWFDEFVVLGFPALIWLTIRSIRRRHLLQLAVVSPSLFSLIAYALMTLNISRYQLTAVTGLALAGGIAVSTLWPRFQRVARNLRKA